MKGIKLPSNRAIGLILIVLAFASIWIFDLPTMYIGLIGSVIFLFVMSIPDYLRLQKELRSMNVIKVKAMRWYNAWIYPAMWIFLFFDSSLDIYTIVTLVMIAAYGVLETIRLYHNYYVVSNQGVMSLDDHRYIVKVSEVMGIETTENGIAIHTVKFKNHLELKSADVISPGWDEVLKQISTMKEPLSKEE